MQDIPEHELEGTRAALAPTLEATAAILPWLTKPRAARFEAKLNERWIAAGKQLSSAWSERHQVGDSAVRTAIFGLYSIAIETTDSDCLRLGEALACAADRLETDAQSPRLLAALSSAVECLNEPAGLEHEAFGERARHFARRLEDSALTSDSTERSPVLDRLFVGEALEHIELMRDALLALPPDAYALTTESIKLAQQAEQLELWGIMHLARQLAESVSRHASELDSPAPRQEIDNLLDALATATSAVDS